MHDTSSCSLAGAISLAATLLDVTRHARGGPVSATGATRASLKIPPRRRPHAHPSGDPKPTDEDVFLTNAVEHAAHLIGIPLADHIIVTPAGRFSSVFRR
ncbi:JAB domain-containing protein [Sorangium sp. So ce1667]